ncbi:MAG TPA: metallophosphoesterase [Thermoanaerobaculia bacterium]|jgi:predicted phosphodiesterase|nr:metallophosphoesterase [Thermoanaerobaculia bacterium]
MRTLSVVLALFCVSGCTTALAPTESRTAIACTGALPPIIEGPTGPSLQILAAGDGGERNAQLEMTIAAMQRINGADAMLLLGDNIYGCGARSITDAKWQSVIAPLFAVGVPIFPVLGNHDWGSKAQPGCLFSQPDTEIQKSGTPGFELWRFPARTYIVNTAVAEIILFDSSPIAYNLADEIAGALCPLRAALAAPKTKPWRIVAAHHPIVSCGDHGNDTSTKHLRDTLQTLLTESGVDLYVAGHDHNLELRSEGDSGPLYLVSGSASRTRSSANCAQSPTFKVTGGFALLDISADELKVNVYCNGTTAPCMERSVRHR